MYLEMRDEIIAMVGAERYRRLVDHIEGCDTTSEVPAPVLKKRS